MSDTPQSYQEALTLVVDGMSCDHCRHAITTEVGQVSDVQSVDVDLETKRVRVHGPRLDPATIVDAIDVAGYDAVPA